METHTILEVCERNSVSTHDYPKRKGKLACVQSYDKTLLVSFNPLVRKNPPNGDVFLAKLEQLLGTHSNRSYPSFASLVTDLIDLGTIGSE